MWTTLRQHWAEYMMEAAELGIFMLAACAFGTLLEHPASPVQQVLGSPVLRRILMGVAMGVTAIGIIYSPWGQQSGAHLNPALTVTFLRLGKVAPWDAIFYIMDGAMRRRIARGAHRGRLSRATSGGTHVDTSRITTTNTHKERSYGS